ncbi:hypothetical protein DL89DRAFT_159259 [Linderina pennispora]|uniref:Uncharacterized protein n=1 Tax=Linderina pennispora TaxID=61395 RepID=A0A1Y1VTZ6_9FUNG|nr:uncharacterized protein DL89DRAFT_159259 [Linderina pennispora]ORX64771.1 hypothetical protein DL89DRAFT_159259 [Linderina pennispora]
MSREGRKGEGRERPQRMAGGYFCRERTGTKSCVREKRGRRVKSRREGDAHSTQASKSCLSFPSTLIGQQRHHSSTLPPNHPMSGLVSQLLGCRDAWDLAIDARSAPQTVVQEGARLEARLPLCVMYVFIACQNRRSSTQHCPARLSSALLLGGLKCAGEPYSHTIGGWC